MIKAYINDNYIYYTVGKNLIKMCFLKHSQQSLTLPTTELQMSWPIPYYTHMLGFESIMFCIANSSIYFTWVAVVPGILTVL